MLASDASGLFPPTWFASFAVALKRLFGDALSFIEGRVVDRESFAARGAAGLIDQLNVDASLGPGQLHSVLQSVFIL
jgi:hypothetical protein